MKETFLKFQLPKEKMNEVRGGSTQICHCGGSTNEFRVEGLDEYDDLDYYVGEVICNGAGWACTPAR